MRRRDARRRPPRRKAQYQLAGRGIIREKNYADLCVFRPEEVRDNAEFWDWMTKRLLSNKEFAQRRAESCRKGADGKLKDYCPKCASYLRRMHTLKTG